MSSKYEMRSKGARLAASVAVASAVFVFSLGAGTAAGAVREYGYVTDTLAIGGTAGEAAGYALQLDGRHPRDNVLGSTLAALSGSVDFDAAIAESIQSGQVLMLQSLRARSLTSDRSAWLQIFFAPPTPDPVLTGRGSFAIDPSAPTSSTLAGTITEGTFSGGPGTAAVRLGLAPGQAPLELHLAAAKVESQCTADACRGKLGGGVPTSEVDTLIIPVLAAAMQSVVDAQCTGPGPDSCTPRARQLLILFDANGDLQITADELRQNILMQALLSPDLDLFRANGTPGQDGVNDAVSLGLGFTTKSATFDAPPGASANHPVTHTRPPLGSQRAFVARMQEVLDQRDNRIEGAGRVNAMGTVEEFASDVSNNFDNFPFAFDIGMRSGSLTSATSGDELIVSYDVTATDTASPPAGENYTLEGTFVIKGGTGSLQNATGSGRITGTCNSSFTSPIATCATDWKGTIGAG